MKIRHCGRASAEHERDKTEGSQLEKAISILAVRSETDISKKKGVGKK